MNPTKQKFDVVPESTLHCEVTPYAPEEYELGDTELEQITCGSELSLDDRDGRDGYEPLLSA